MSDNTSNHPCGDLLDQGKRRDYIDICVPLYEASTVGDWEAAKNILEIHRESKELVGYSITEDKDTPLHIATLSENVKFVERLVERMTDKQLAFQNIHGYTALYHVAGVGNVDMAKAMVTKCPQLLTIRDTGERRWLPIVSAAEYGKREMVNYLYDEYKKSMNNDHGWTWTDRDLHQLFYRCVEADLFDCALKILDDQNNDVGFPQLLYARDVLYILARETNAFKDIKSWKNSITWVRPVLRESNLATKLLKKIWKIILERQSDEINDILKGPMVITSDQKKTYPFPILFVAAERGNIKFLIELIHGYPELSWRENDDNQNIFHIAVSHRHASIYNLLNEMGSIHDIMTRIKDKDGNNMLHLAGMEAKSPIEDVSGAAFQMQRELLWFKEVNSKIPPYCREEKNNDGHTPLQLFTHNHQGMVSKGENWMKETARNCMLVAALITTAVFSVAFTIPRGYSQNNGLSFFLRDGLFIAFIIFDAISLILSSTSTLMFLSILTSRYAQQDFLISLPTKLMIGLTILFFSIINMMVAFAISFFVLYRNKLNISVPIIISVGTIVPIFVYLKLQLPLLVDVYRSTYGSRYLFRPKKRVLFYRNPSF